MFLKYSRETITTKPRFEVTKEISTSSRIRAIQALSTRLIKPNFSYLSKMPDVTLPFFGQELTPLSLSYPSASYFD